MAAICRHPYTDFHLTRSTTYRMKQCPEGPRLNKLAQNCKYLDQKPSSQCWGLCCSCCSCDCARVGRYLPQYRCKMQVLWCNLLKVELWLHFEPWKLTKSCLWWYLWLGSHERQRAQMVLPLWRETCYAFQLLLFCFMQSFMMFFSLCATWGKIDWFMWISFQIMFCFISLFEYVLWYNTFSCTHR